MKEVSGTLRLDLAQYRELQAFAQFGSDLDATTQQQLTRGARLVELLKQPQYSPVPVQMQIVHILAGNSGAIDDVAEREVLAFIKDLTSHFNSKQKALLDEIIEKQTFKKNDLQARIVEAIKSYRANWSK
jgi:F-type H+-transporting ATPase subunit alpha